MIWSMLLLMSVWKSDSFFPRSTWPLSALLLGAKGKSGATALRRLRSALLSQVSKLLKPCAEVELNKLLPLGHRRWTQTEFDAIRFPSGPSGLIVWSVDFGLQTCLLYHIIVSYYSVLIYIYIDYNILYYTTLCHVFCVQTMSRSPLREVSDLETASLCHLLPPRHTRAASLHALQSGHKGYPLVICYIAIENGPFIVDLPIFKDCDFP